MTPIDGEASIPAETEDDSAFIQYFVAVMQDQPQAEHWTVWFPAHEAELKEKLSPGCFLRMKAANPMAEILRLLQQRGIEIPAPEGWIHPKFYVQQTIPGHWLTEKIGIEELDGQLRGSLLYPKFLMMQRFMLPGDEWWRFNSGGRTWQKMMGRMGFALVRNRAPVDHVVTMMN